MSLSDTYLAIKNKQFKILVTTPERLTKNDDFINLIKDMYANKSIDRFVFDEVYCLKTWVDDFRDVYKNFKMLKQHYPSIPILSLTENATLLVREDIVSKLALQDKFHIF